MTAQPLLPSINVLIVDDHEMVSEMMATILALEADLSVVGRSATIAAATALVATTPVDVVLMDYQLPDGNGVTAAAEIRRAHPQIRVVIVTGVEDEGILRDALQAGCSGYLLKTEGVSQLAVAVRAAHAGSMAVSPEMLAHVMNSLTKPDRKPGTDELTQRELDVLRLLVEGMSGDDIGERLHVSVNTVRNHTQNILEKLDAHSKLEAVTKALRLGLVKPPR